MAKWISIFTITVFFFISCEQKQNTVEYVDGNILPNYKGFWSETVHSWNGERYNYKLDAIDVIEYYPDKLDIIRNEIYARYGRPFVNQKYKNYFLAQKWYVENQNYSDDWLTEREKENATFILSIEKAGHCYDAINEARKEGIIYTGVHDIHFPLFTASLAVAGTTSPYTGDYIFFEKDNWIVVGNWILTFSKDGFYHSEGRYQVTSYLIDPETKNVIDYDYSQINGRDFDGFIFRQGSTKMKYTKDW